MVPPAISLTGVSKSYRLYRTKQDRLKEALHPFGKKYHRDFFALENIDLEIGSGEVVGIVGRNGSGKSTLLKIISHVLPPTKGTVDIKGKVSALLELGSGFNPEFTGIENIYFYSTILGLTRREIGEKLDSIIEFADIGQFLYQPLKTYSSGMRARLGFAVAAHIDPEILILDEVLAVGDDVFRRKCYAKMEEFFDSGRTIVYVSHDINSVNQLCTRAVMLDAGRILLDDRPKTVTTYYQKLLFANPKNVESVRREIDEVAECGTAGGSRGPVEVSPQRFLDELVSKSRVEYGTSDVSITGERMVDRLGRKINVLEYGETYWFEVDVAFGIRAEDVAFGLELKDLKGVLVTSVESARLFQFSRSFDEVLESEVFSLRYEFPCLLTTGTYLANFGVSTYAGGQSILNRVIDIYMFKVDNPNQFSAGYVQLVKRLDVARGSGSVHTPLLRNDKLAGM